MFRAILPYVSLFALLVILSACQSEGKIEGEVFIVTEGRDNVEMGLVEVKAIPAEELNTKLREKLEESKTEVKGISEKLSKQLKEIRRNSEEKKILTENFVENEKETNEIMVKKDGFLSEGKRAPRFKDKRVKDVENGPSIGEEIITYNQKTKLKKSPTLLEGKQNEVKKIISRGERGVIVDIDTLWENYKLQIDGVSGWTSGANTVPAEDWGIVEEKREKLKKIKESVGRMERSIAEKTERVNEITAQVQESFGTLKRYRSNGFYFSSLPEPLDVDKTDSDGTYELTVEAGEPHYVVAEAERSVGDEEEQYYWMVETTVSGGETKELNLTNDNLGGVANKKYSLNERTLSTVEGIWQSAISLAKEGEEMNWEKLIYRTAFPEDTTEVPIPDELDVPEEKLLSNR